MRPKRLLGMIVLGVLLASCRDKKSDEMPDGRQVSDGQTASPAVPSSGSATPGRACGTSTDCEQGQLCWVNKHCRPEPLPCDSDADCSALANARCVRNLRELCPDCKSMAGCMAGPTDALPGADAPALMDAGRGGSLPPTDAR